MTAKSRTSRSFPRTCLKCGRVAVQLSSASRTCDVKYDGVVYSVSVPSFPIEKCGSCGNVTVGVEADDAIDQALRRHIGLLLPHQIAAGRKILGLTQQQLADQIGCASESMSRWETGAVVQTKTYDKVLRLVFGLPEARRFLIAMENDKDLGSRVSA